MNPNHKALLTAIAANNIEDVLQILPIVEDGMFLFEEKCHLEDSLGRFRDFRDPRYLIIRAMEDRMVSLPCPEDDEDYGDF